MHIVHKKMTSSNNKVQDSDKLAVLGFMVEVGLPSPRSWRSLGLQKELLGCSSSQRTHLILLSLLSQVGETTNKGFQPLVEALSRISKPCESGWGRGWLLL